MSTLPTNLLTQNVAKPTVKADAKSAVSVNGQVAAGEGAEVKSAEGNSFASFFSNLMGDSKVEGKGEGKSEKDKTSTELAAEAKAETSKEGKLDVLLKDKHQTQNNRNIEEVALSTDKALSPEILKNVSNLIDRTPLQTQTTGADGKVVDQKIAAASTNLDQLLKTLKGQNNDEVIIEEGAEGQVPASDAKNIKAESALDFLLKQSKESDVVGVDAKTLQKNPEMTSKLGLSSEDFLGHKAEAKSAKNSQEALVNKLLGKVDGEGQAQGFDANELVQKQLNQSMKSYGQKQNLLNDGVIKNNKDLAFKDTKPKSTIDELTTPDLKIGADLSGMKDQFIPVLNKQEAGQNMATQNQGQVLDLSKINSSNTTEIIKRISDYVQQSQVANSSSLDLTVKHESLGQFNIQVNKPTTPGSNHMDMQITTSTKEGHEFFMKNEIGLMKNLSQAGIQLSDLRIVSGGEAMSFTQSDSRQSGNNSQFNQQTPKEFMSFDSGNSSQGSDRRKELWQEARANQQRYGA